MLYMKTFRIRFVSWDQIITVVQYLLLASILYHTCSYDQRFIFLWQVAEVIAGFLVRHRFAHPKEGFER